jgi:hypothetical protein
MQPQTEIKAVTQQIYDPGQLPLVLKTQDVMNLCRCSKPSALDIIRKAEKQGMFVLWVCNQPRVNRDVFIEWLQTRKSRKSI